MILFCVLTDSSKLVIIIAIASSIAAATSLVFIGAYVGYRKLSKKREGRCETLENIVFNFS